MKVTLDLNRLLAEGKITRAEFDKLGALSTQDTASLAFNVLMLAFAFALWKFNRRSESVIA
jgi:hypothetical protein